MMIMREEDIPAFVEAVISTGCNITAIGDEYYTIGDLDLPEPLCYEVQEELSKITQTFGARDHLRLEIVAYLHSIGRSYIPHRDDAETASLRVLH